MRKLKLASAMLAIAMFFGNSGFCQKPAEVNPVEYVPGQTLASISLWPSRLAASDAMEFAPLEVLTAAGLENFAIDPLKITRVDIMIGMPGFTGPQFGALIQSSEAIDIEALNPEMIVGEGIVNDNGYQYVQLQGPEELTIHSIDANTVIFGTKVFAKMMVKNGDRNSDVATVLGAVKTEQDALAIVSINSLRPLLEGFAQGAPLPPQVVEELSTVVEATEFLALRVQISDEEKLQLVVSGNNAGNIEKVESSLSNLIAFAHEQITTEFKANVPQESLTGKAMHAYIDRMGTEITTALKPARSGVRLVYEIRDFQDISVIGSLTGMLLPAIQASRNAAFQVQAANNLKQLGLSMHNFESAFKTLPASSGLDDDGEPMISWRVAVLPFLGENQLYNEFKLDEPWDSDHNIALLERMPAVFKHPDRETEAGYTVYQVVVGDDTIFQLKEPTKFSQITDGLSNTVMIVETDAERAVPWTAPQDYELDVENPAAGLFVEGFCYMLFGDGHVQKIADSVDVETIKAMFTRSGGEVVNIPD